MIMKIMKMLLMTMAVMAAMTSCKAGENYSIVKENYNDKVVKEKCNVDSFNEIVIIGSFDVQFRQDKTYSIEVVAPVDMQDKVVIETGRKQLKIGSKKIAGVTVTGGRNTIMVNITAPYINSVKLMGSGDFTANTIKAPSQEMTFKATLQGSGDININRVEATAVLVDLQGSGDIDIKNIEAKQNVTAKVQGSGDIEIDRIDSETFVAGLYGTGDLKAHVNCSTLNAALSGVGDIELIGKTKVYHKSKTGSGDIKDEQLDCEYMVDSNGQRISDGQQYGNIESMP